MQKHAEILKNAGRVAGKVALVTGAASGIGRATSLLFSREGAVVACADVNAEGVSRTSTEITAAGGAALALTLDVSSEEAWVAGVARVLEKFNRLDILVNAAGISHGRPVTETSIEEWRQVLAVNLDGVFLGTKHAIRAMKAHGGAGSIINVSSAAGIRPAPGASAYSTSKAAVTMFTRTIAAEVGASGAKIRINSISPGAVKTPIWSTMPFFQEIIAKTGSEEAAFAAVAQSLPQGRLAAPEEIAEAVLFLASDAASFITGIDLVVDAGFTA